MDSIAGVQPFEADTRLAQRKPFRQPKTSSEVVAKLIAVLALARATTVTQETLRVYANGLDGFLREDIEAAVAQMSAAQRPDGRTALPSLGEMVTACQTAAQRRHEAASADRQRKEAAYAKAHPEKFVSWKEVMEDMQMQRDACEAHFGEGWRSRLVWNGRDAKGNELPGSIQLGDLYEQMMREAR